ncbi:MAG: polyhydroxyalkanoate granule-associated phasin [Burkholderiales bacterium]
MAISRTRTRKSLAVKSAELALAVPQVVAHRVTRMAMAGPTLSPRDRKEFDLMVAEKESAFAASWSAMATQTVRANQALATSMFRSFWSAALRGKPVRAPSAAALRRAALGIVGKGLDPVHRKAVANAKRLAKTRLR